MNEWEIDEQQPAGQEDHVGVERDPIGKRAGDQSRRNDGEHHLIGDKYDRRNGIVAEGGWGVEANPVQTGHVQIADDSQNIAVPVSARETQRVATDVPQDGGPTHRDEALDHNRQHVLSADQAAVEKS